MENIVHQREVNFSALKIDKSHNDRNIFQTDAPFRHLCFSA